MHIQFCLIELGTQSWQNVIFPVHFYLFTSLKAIPYITHKSITLTVMKSLLWFLFLFLFVCFSDSPMLRTWKCNNYNSSFLRWVPVATFSSHRIFVRKVTTVLIFKGISSKSWLKDMTSVTRQVSGKGDFTLALVPCHLRGEGCLRYCPLYFAAFYLVCRCWLAHPSTRYLVK